MIVDKPSAPQAELRIGRIGTVRTTPDFPALQVLNEAIGGGFTSRLNLDLREEKGYTYGIGSRFEYGRRPGPFVVRTAVKSDVAVPAIREILAQLKRAGAAPLTPEELQRARGSLTQSLPAMFETNGATGSSFGELFAYALPLDYFRQLPSQLATVRCCRSAAAGAALFRSGVDGRDRGRRSCQPAARARGAEAGAARSLADRRQTVLTMRRCIRV